MKNKNSDLWTKCQHYKKISCNLNYKLRGHEVLKELPLEIEKLYTEIETFKDNLDKFVGSHEALNKIIKVQRNPKEEKRLCSCCGVPKLMTGLIVII